MNNNWPTIKLGEVLEINYGKGLHKNNRIDSGNYLAYGSNGPVYSTNESLTSGEIIVIGRKGTAGALYFVSKPCWPIDTTFFAKPKDDTSLKFIYYLLLTKNLPRLAIVTGVPGINRITLANVNIQIPPLEIQKQIVERMDKIAEAQKLNDELIKKADEFFQSLLHKELNPTGKNWEQKKLGEICEINPSKMEINGFPDDSEIGFLTMADVSEDAEMINVQTRKLKEVKKGFTYFRNGDVLFAKITPCMENGKGALAEGMKNGIGFGSTEFHVLRAKPEFVLNKLLYFIVNDKSFRKNAQRFMRGAVGQQRVPSDYLEKFKISLPPLKIQKQIVEKLSAAQEYKKQLLEQKLKLKELFDSVLHKSMNFQG